MRVAVLADVHGNLHALEAVLADARDEGAEAVWMAGDWVGYGAFPEECVGRLRSLGAVGIAGDMDREVLAAAAGSYPGSAPAEKREALRFAAGALSRDSRRFLAGLPAQRSLVVDGRSVLLVHGSPADAEEHLWPETPPERLRELAGGIEAELVLCGHTHKGMNRTAAGVRFLNPGSVGRPADGDPRAAWGLLEVTEGLVRWHANRVAYDHTSAAQAIVERGMPELVARMVREGRGLRRLKKGTASSR